MKGIIDSTLREGEQTPGVNFSLEEKLSITLLLELVGVEEIELGIATEYNHELAELMQYCRREIKNSRLSLWSRCRAGDIHHAASLEPDTLSLSIPASDLHITEKLGKSRSWCLETLSSSIRLAKSLGIASVSVGLEDATRADEDFLLQLINTAEQKKADRIRIADTVGIATPNTISRLVQTIKNTCDLEIAVHTHNDFGMATANAVSALEAGAHWADATVLGLGERAGNCRLEEITGYLSLGSGKRPYNTRLLRSLCQAAASASDREIAPNHPLIGESIFTCETGIHLHGLHKNPATYEPYRPEEVGIHRKLLLGRKSGKRALAERLSRAGLVLTEDKLREALLRLRNLPTPCTQPLNDQDLLTIATA